MQYFICQIKSKHFKSAYMYREYISYTFYQNISYIYREYIYLVLCILKKMFSKKLIMKSLFSINRILWKAILTGIDYQYYSVRNIVALIINCNRNWICMETRYMLEVTSFWTYKGFYEKKSSNREQNTKPRYADWNWEINQC